MRNQDDRNNTSPIAIPRAGRLVSKLRRTAVAGWGWVFGTQHHRTLGALHIIAGIVSLAGFDPAVMKSCYLLIGLVYVLYHGR